MKTKRDSKTRTVCESKKYIDVHYIFVKLAGLSLPEEMISRKLEKPRRCLLVTASLQYKGVLQNLQLFE